MYLHMYNMCLTLYVFWEIVKCKSKKNVKFENESIEIETSRKLVEIVILRRLTIISCVWIYKSLLVSAIKAQLNWTVKAEKRQGNKKKIVQKYMAFESLITLFANTIKNGGIWAKIWSDKKMMQYGLCGFLVFESK